MIQDLQRLTRTLRCAIPLFLLFAATTLLLTSAGCSTRERTTAPPTVELVPITTGTLTALRDDRPVDGGVDLTIEVGPGVTDQWRVPSVFMKPPDPAVVAMHSVVNAARIGDRLRATGARDTDGALRVATLEILPGR
ncbi:MAG: hypothetical protein HOP12_05795 [Candidatus Eisenbacteria bacterium]|uniref:Uncharacterized protein n=1 Tax=Eiseniibacteriota bacterium TaxID=2212470 RepID=A0A849SX00_UNCEI|nr:hypothetical protein [Candidatus Eisenbacteria bacterium]